ncbi:MAG: hypothetical protein P8R54_17720 [Myxococcota bacterium]|nr:hypothetical protein [Myxococcota bacterium]
MLWLVWVMTGAADPARTAAQAGDFAGELSACTAILAGASRDRAWSRCQRRVLWLQARQDTDGSFTAMTTLSRIRHDYTRQPRSDAIAEIHAAFHAPQTAAAVRLEAGLWLARELLDNQSRPDRALSYTTPLYDVYPEDRSLTDLHARALASVGRTAEALSIEEAAEPIRSANPVEGLPLLLRQQRRDRLQGVSLAVVAVFCLIAAPLALRGRRQIRLVGLVPLLGLTAGFALIGGLRDATVLPTFLGVAFSMGIIHLLSSGATAAAPRGRSMIGILAGLASLAAGYLTLYQTNQLGSIGL